QALADDPLLAAAGQRYVPLEARDEATAEISPLPEALDASTLAILSGPLGSGKTFTLRHLAWLRARQALTPAGAGETPIPLFLDLSEWTADRTLEELLLAEIQRRLPHVNAASLAARLPRAHPLYLCDNLNALTTPGSRQHFWKWLAEQRRTQPHARFIIATRPEAWQEEEAPSVSPETWQILPLHDRNVDLYIERYAAGGTAAAIRRCLRQDPPLWDLVHLPLFLRSALQLAGRPESPLPWWSRCAIVAEALQQAQHLPDKSAWQAWLETTGAGIAELAFILQQAQATGTAQSPCAGIAKAAGSLLPQASACGVLLPQRDAGDFAFIHPLVQDFFAAAALKSRFGARLSPAIFIQDAQAQAAWQGALIQLYGLSEDRRELLHTWLSAGDAKQLAPLIAECMLNNEPTAHLPLKTVEFVRLTQSRSSAFGFGLALKQLGQLEAARAAFREALTLKPSSQPKTGLQETAEAAPDSLDQILQQLHAGRIQRELEQPAQALTELQSALTDVERLYASIHYEIGVTLLQERRETEALAAFTEAQARDPESPLYA
ncbi:MAG TPA: NACHT domain-containing protein, partial [Anaerolineae bacterium]|nr:NACHT domain-containing protein [Anaerolineae bacterium]